MMGNLLSCKYLSIFLLAAADSPITVPSSGHTSYNVTLLNGEQPIITKGTFVAAGVYRIEEGQNINGPSVIRIPDWIRPEDRVDPSAIYYLYFAHHKGRYIRLAWAADIEGPYTLYNVGPGVPLGRRGVLSLDLRKELYSMGERILLNEHIASPDVHVDHDDEHIVMYFHAPVYGVGRQKSFVATSDNGLNFNGKIEPVILAKSYLRVFQYKGHLYGIANGGDIYKAHSQTDPWTPPPGFDYRNDLWIKSPESVLRARHSSVRLVGDILEVFYSRKSDKQERILLSTIDLSLGTYETWNTSFPPEEIRRPLLSWEGANYELLPSKAGPANCCVNQLRDPYIFEDKDGTLYLFYSAQGENSLGLARLDPIEG